MVTELAELLGGVGSVALLGGAIRAGRKRPFGEWKGVSPLCDPSLAKASPTPDRSVVVGRPWCPGSTESR